MKQFILTEKVKQLMLVVLIAGAITGCGPSTKVVKSWHEPNSTISAAATNRVLVVAMVKDEAARRVIEDNLVKRIGATAVPSYSVITEEAMKEANGDKFSDKLKQDKYTHVILQRLADIEKETSYVPGTTTGFYGGYGRYYGYGAGLYGTPGYYTTDKNYFVETTVYSVEPDKLLWTGTTKTVNPSKLDKTITEIADVVSDKMRKDGFLK